MSDKIYTYITCIDGRWYAFGGDAKHDQVYSIGADKPREPGNWYARWSRTGLGYVATSSPTRAAAYKKAARHGKYSGEVEM